MKLGHQCAGHHRRRVRNRVRWVCTWSRTGESEGFMRREGRLFTTFQRRWWIFSGVKSLLEHHREDGMRSWWGMVHISRCGCPCHRSFLEMSNGERWACHYHCHRNRYVLATYSNRSLALCTFSSRTPDQWMFPWWSSRIERLEAFSFLVAHSKSTISSL